MDPTYEEYMELQRAAKAHKKSVQQLREIIIDLLAIADWAGREAKDQAQIDFTDATTRKARKALAVHMPVLGGRRKNAKTKTEDVLSQSVRDADSGGSTLSD